jgi:hypothetical protein
MAPYLADLLLILRAGCARALRALAQGAVCAGFLAALCCGACTPTAAVPPGPAAAADTARAAVPQSAPGGTPTAVVLAPSAGLSIEVVPPEGIAIWLEGTRLATRSPFTSTTLRPGAYTLLVRGMGYLPFTLPVELKAGEMVRLPVSLQPRLQVGDPPSVGAATGPQRQAAQVVTSPTVPLSTPLPDGVAPLLVRLVPSPATRLSVDGAPAQGEVRLRFGHGVLQAGSLRIEYDVTPSRVLEFVVPNDGGLWFKDGTQVKPTSVIRITLGSTRLQRTALGGAPQSIVIKRIL